MDAHYRGYLLRVTAKPVPDTNRWTCFAAVHFDTDAQELLKTFNCEGREFFTPYEATRAGFEITVKWIDDGKPGVSASEVKQ